MPPIPTKRAGKNTLNKAPPAPRATRRTTALTHTQEGPTGNHRGTSLCSGVSSTGSNKSVASEDGDYLDLHQDDFDSADEDNVAQLLQSSGMQAIQAVQSTPRSTGDPIGQGLNSPHTARQGGSRKRPRPSTIEEEDQPQRDELASPLQGGSPEDWDTLLSGQSRIIELLEKISASLSTVATVQKTGIERMDSICRATGLQQVRIEALQRNTTGKTAETAPLYTSLEIEQPVSHTPVVHSSATGSTGVRAVKPAR